MREREKKGERVILQRNKNAPWKHKNPKVCSMGHASMAEAGLARSGAVVFAQSTYCTVLSDTRKQNDYEQDPGDTAMINACQMIRGATEAGEMDLWYKLNYKNCLHRLEPRNCILHATQSERPHDFIILLSYSEI